MTDDDIDPRFFELVESRDLGLRNELVVANQGLAIAFARRYRDRGVGTEDLEQVALEALVRAVDRFDPERGLRFSTFAARTIEGSLKQYFRDRTWDVSVPRSTRQLVVAVKAAAGSLMQRLGRSATPAELAAELGVDLADVTLALEASMAYRTGDLTPVVEGAQGESDPELARVDARVMTPQLLAVLPENERAVVELRFFEGLSQVDIAARIGVSQMQVSRLLRRSLATLREELGAAEAGADV